jgi:hypothetical protein
MKKKMIYDIVNRNREVRRTGNNNHDKKETKLKRENQREEEFSRLFWYARVTEQNETNEIE